MGRSFERPPLVRCRTILDIWLHEGLSPSFPDAMLWRVTSTETLTRTQTVIRVRPPMSNPLSSRRSKLESTELQERRSLSDREVFAQALAACRRALHEQLETGQSTAALRGSVTAFAAAARRQLVPPERVLSVFKQMLTELPTVQRSDLLQRAELTADLTRMVIDAYYELRET